MKARNQLLRDENMQPTDEIVAQGLGGANKAFIQFIEMLKQEGVTLMEWRYYHDGKAWLSKGEYKWTTPRGANKVKPIFWLSIWEGFFRVAFFFATSVQDELLGLPISEQAKGLIKNAKPMGKTMRFIPVVFDIENDLLLGDVLTIAAFRKVRVK
jgi:hypothetical protein